mmetsp:Transcript_40397/g.102249  ORF Transcript_40397/g.102249 Transcript_40397/m.102249 type:complete len:250 (-) Transcript_40397:525-1274(-)
MEVGGPAKVVNQEGAGGERSDIAHLRTRVTQTKALSAVLLWDMLGDKALQRGVDETLARAGRNSCCNQERTRLWVQLCRKGCQRGKHGSPCHGRGQHVLRLELGGGVGTAQAAEREADEEGARHGASEAVTPSVQLCHGEDADGHGAPCSGAHDIARTAEQQGPRPCRYAFQRLCKACFQTHGGLFSNFQSKRAPVAIEGQAARREALPVVVVVVYSLERCWLKRPHQRNAKRHRNAVQKRGCTLLSAG